MSKETLLEDIVKELRIMNALEEKRQERAQDRDKRVDILIEEFLPAYRTLLDQVIKEQYPKEI